MIIIGILIIVFVSFSLLTLWNIENDIAESRTYSQRAYEIILNWAIYYASEEHHKGNDMPFKFIFPEYKMKDSDECHVDKEQE